MADQFTARKLWCLDHVMRDARATHLDFRIAYYIGHAADRATGEARVKQSTIGKAVGAERRSVQRCIERLQQMGHLDVVFAPGRSHVNGYRLCLEKATLESPLETGDENERISTAAEKATVGSHIGNGKGDPRVLKRRPQGPEKATRHSHQSFPCLIPCLIPSRAREPAIAEALGSLGAALEARLGAEIARSWFGKAEILDCAGETLTLRLPSPFHVDRVRSEYERALLQVCANLVPAVQQVRLVTARAAA